MAELGLTEAQASAVTKAHFEAVKDLQYRRSEQEERERLHAAIAAMLPCLLEVRSLHSVLNAVQYAYRQEHRRRVELMEDALRQKAEQNRAEASSQAEPEKEEPADETCDQL